MKAFMTLLLISFSLFSFGSEKLTKEDFKIKNYNGEYFLQKKDVDLKLFKLEGLPQNSKVLDVINNEKAPHLYFITHLSSYAGTSVSANIYKAVVWDNKKKLFVGNIYYKTVVKGKTEDQDETLSAKWIFEKDEMIVKREDEILDKVPY